MSGRSWIEGGKDAWIGVVVWWNEGKRHRLFACGFVFVDVWEVPTINDVQNFNLTSPHSR